MDYRSMSNEALSAEKADLEKRYADFKARGLKLNMARGKPGVDQLDLSMPMLDILNSTSNIYASTGDDCRNYGLGDGLPEMRELFAEMLGIDDHNIIGRQLQPEYDVRCDLLRYDAWFPRLQALEPAGASEVFVPFSGIRPAFRNYRVLWF